MATIYCPECSGRRLVTFDHPNDPCARLEPCDACDATGIARCALCRDVAVDAVVVGRSFTPLCERHFTEHMAEVGA